MAMQTNYIFVQKVAWKCIGVHIRR